MKEKHNRNSKFKIYFDTLPEKFNTGILTAELCHPLCTYTHTFSIIELHKYIGYVFHFEIANCIDPKLQVRVMEVLYTSAFTSDLRDLF